MDINPEPRSYLDKVFQEPEYIWNDGVCNIDAVQDSILHLPARLAEIVPEVQNLTEISPDKTLDIDTRPAVSLSRSAIMPLRSDVWNGMEPINYVSACFHI